MDRERKKRKGQKELQFVVFFLKITFTNNLHGAREYIQICM